jgi:hypothetical protein
VGGCTPESGGPDPEDVFGWRVSELLPRPIPFGFHLLDPVERGWRGRATIRLWLLGFSVRTAWLHAMSKDAEWSECLSHEHLDLVDDWKMPGEVLRQRLMEVVSAE